VWSFVVLSLQAVTLQAVTDAHGVDRHGVGANNTQPHGLGQPLITVIPVVTVPNGYPVTVVLVVCLCGVVLVVCCVALF